MKGACRDRATRTVEWGHYANRGVLKGRFCEAHWPDREHFRPANSKAAATATLKIRQLFAGTHHLVEACRNCGNVQYRATICDACGGADLEPTTEASKRRDHPPVDPNHVEPFENP